MILLVAIIAAIALTHAPRARTASTRIRASRCKVQREDRVRIVKMPSGTIADCRDAPSRDDRGRVEHGERPADELELVTLAHYLVLGAILFAIASSASSSTAGT